MLVHETYMQRCLQLARQGAGYVAPNPMVGAVLVFENRIIGEGYHEVYGGPHAEVNCINAVAATDKHLIEKACLYVSLEPCSHFGKTPPCTKLIIEKKIATVVIGCRDTYAEVNGKGIEKLKAAGVNVVEGILEKESKYLNRRFFIYHQYKRPYIILKWAQTADGFIGNIVSNNGRLLISNDYSNKIVHQWRSEEAAIMVGTNTALMDNPLLTNRLWTGASPVRVVLDLENKLPHTLHVFDNKITTIVINKTREGEEGNLVYRKIVNDKTLPNQVCDILYQLRLQSVLIEGGGQLLQSFIDEGLWDETRIIKNTGLLIGTGVKAPLLKSEQLVDVKNYLHDEIGFYLHN
jgi:diaminohydroxyphosphoribosylaminopyrimidine deaminase / 5-amino-6-(5-phosphoribosylamino)uracil reductase